MNSRSQNRDGSSPKLFHKGPLNDSSGFRGCEQDNLIIHFDYVLNDAPYFERFSRARQNLIGILEETTLLFVDYPFPSTMNEMLKHEENCENEKCKENGWDKLKVVDVEYI